METITLSWMNKIRARMEEVKISHETYDFLEPIIKYGEAEEKRITKEFGRKENGN